MFSPVPSQTTAGLLASTATWPSEYEPPSSKIGSQLIPWLVVFHSPPDPWARYHVLRIFRKPVDADTLAGFLLLLVGKMGQGPYDPPIAIMVTEKRTAAGRTIYKIEPAPDRYDLPPEGNQ